MGAHHSRRLGDPRDAQSWLKRELTEPWITKFPAWQQVLNRNLALTHVQTGELAEARRLLSKAEVSRDMGLTGQLAFRAGDWLQADAEWTRAREQAQGGGDRFNEQDSLLGLVQLRMAQGRYPEAEALLSELLEIVVGQNLPLELPARVTLILVSAAAHRLRQAERHLDRCREILANGEDWRGLAGHAAVAEAVVAGTSGRLDEAARQFDQAIAVFRQYDLPWDEAEALYWWGRVLLAAGNRAAAVAKLDMALDIYRSHGAGERWLERVLVDQRRAQAKAGTRGRQALPPAPAYPDGLSEREVEVLRLIAAGKSNQTIADALIISPNTVFRHVNHIFTKTGVANRAEATSYAYRRGLVQ